MTDGYIVKSNLKLWPGRVTLPPPEQFNGLMWQDWRKFIEDGEPTTINRLYCYAALRFIEKHGTWEMDIPLAEVKAWEHKPADEMVMLVSWIGKRMQQYMNQILDPKG